MHGAAWDQAVQLQAGHTGQYNCNDFTPFLPWLCPSACLWLLWTPFQLIHIPLPLPTLCLITPGPNHNSWQPIFPCIPQNCSWSPDTTSPAIESSRDLCRAQAHQTACPQELLTDMPTGALSSTSTSCIYTPTPCITSISLMYTVVLSWSVFGSYDLQWIQSSSAGRSGPA
jgi:hypothetical protein